MVIYNDYCSEQEEVGCKGRGHLGDSHEQFIEDCLENDLIPKGLRVTLEPQAFMACKTDIKKEWDTKLVAMSKSLLQVTLADHYLKVVSGLVTEIDKVQHQLDNPPFSPFSPTPQELQVHKTILKKTEDNLTKFQKSLEETAQKINHLHNPTNPNNKPRNPRKQGKGNQQHATNPNPTFPILTPNPGHMQMRRRIFAPQAPGTSLTTGPATGHTQDIRRPQPKDPA